jgi:protein-S-isoprenylcysteine O-methyltransferase Ste14
VNVVGMRLKVMLFASVLVLVGLTLFFYGTSISNDLMKPESLISGTYLVVVGIFLAIAGFLMLMLQMFQRHSLIY